MNSMHNIRNQLSLATRIPNKVVNISKVNTGDDRAGALAATGLQASDLRHMRDEPLALSQLNRSDNMLNPALITEQVSPSNNGSLADTKQALNFSKLKPEGSPDYHDINSLAAAQFDQSPLKSMYLKGLNDLVQYQQRLQASGLTSAQIQDPQVSGFDRARHNTHTNP